MLHDTNTDMVEEVREWVVKQKANHRERTHGVRQE
jgi:hypothetical protein